MPLAPTQDRRAGNQVGRCKITLLIIINDRDVKRNPLLTRHRRLVSTDHSRSRRWAGSWRGRSVRWCSSTPPAMSIPLLRGWRGGRGMRHRSWPGGGLKRAIFHALLHCCDYKILVRTFIGEVVSCVPAYTVTTYHACLWAGGNWGTTCGGTWPLTTIRLTCRAPATRVG